MVNEAALKVVGAEMKAAMVRDNIRATTKSTIRTAIVARVAARRGLTEAERRFLADHLMALYGYGGGAR